MAVILERAHNKGRISSLPLFPQLSHTSKNADVVLLCGDLNMHPKDLGCCLLKEWTGLHDAFVETEDFKVRDCFPPTPHLFQSSCLLAS